MPGYHGPTLSHGAGPLHEDVVRAVGLDAAGLDWIRPDPCLTALGPDGRVARVFADDDRTARALREVSEHDAGRWPEFSATMRRLAAVMATLSRHAPPDIDQPSFADGLRLLSTGRAARGLGPRHLARLLRYAPMAVADIADEWFESDLVKGAVAAHAVYGHLAGPWSAGTGALLLQRIAADPFPLGSGMTLRGGPGALSAALTRLAMAAGVTVRPGAHVAVIGTQDGAVAGVTLGSGEQIAARAVVAAIDPRQLFLSLVDPAALPPSFLGRMRQFRARGVTAKITLALDAMPPAFTPDGRPAPPDHRMLIAPAIDEIERAYDAAKYGACSPRPWLEISVPTMLDPSLAPAGRHVMSVVAHYAPHTLAAGTWADEREPLFNRVMAVLDDHFPGLPGRVVGREIVTPADLEARWGLSGGHIFHGEMTLDQWWVARPLLGWARHRTPIGGLFLAGAGAHPGGGAAGLPGLLGARAAAEY
jgi:phytoene dehydrogenase-like protein